jgi:4-hydroxyphenylpyruvate dioxygenase
MDKGLATVCLSGTLDEKLAAAAAADFTSVELFEPDLLGSRRSPAELAARADALGLRLSLYQPFRDFEGVGKAQLERNLRRAEAKFDLMTTLGIDTMLVCSSVRADTIDDDALAAEQLALLADRAAGHGVRIAYEALAWGARVNRYEHAWRIVRDAGHPALGTCLDSFHILSRGDDPAGIAAIPGDRIFFVQLADAPRLRMDVLQWSRHYRCFPGQGEFDLAGFCRAVLDAGYAGPLSLEVFNDVFRRSDPERTAIDAMRSLLVLEDELGAARLPSPPPLDGYAFAELAVGADTGPDTEALLEAIGLRHVGPHRSKPVQLWERGEARVLVTHGERATSGVAALAVSCDAPADAIVRADALLAPVLARRRGVDEADLAAVAAPDGTQVFVADGSGSWRQDFVAVGPPAGEGDGHGWRLDHVVLAHPVDAFDEAVLFYRSLLGLEPSASQDVASPNGLIRSRAMSTADGSVRLVLNAPVLGDAGADAPQHVALACNDVLAVARRMHARGAPPLPVPGNYYDDLAARFDLDPELLEQLRALDVLYDADGDGGVLLHLYTQTVGRIAFEVLERCGGYAGYGAANSPVRLAAQRAQDSMRATR